MTFKKLTLITLLFSNLSLFSQKKTENYQPENITKKFLTETVGNTGMFSIKIERCINKVRIKAVNGQYLEVYQFQIWFKSYSKLNSNDSETFIPNVNIYFDNKFIEAENVSTVNGEYVLTYYSINKYPDIKVTYDNPQPY